MSTFNPTIHYVPYHDPSVKFDNAEWSYIDHIQPAMPSEMFGLSFPEDYPPSYSRLGGEDPGWYEIVTDYDGFSESEPTITAVSFMFPERTGIAVLAGVSPPDTTLLSDLRTRLNEVNMHFRRKAASVLNDDAALRLLAVLYSKTVVRTSDFDFCKDGRSLAKLTAAHFCEVGANGIYITDRGQRLIRALSAT